MSEDIDAGDIHRPERGAARPADGRTGDGVHFFDRVLAACNRIERSRHAIKGDVVSDEVGRVFGDHDAFSEMVIGKVANGRDDRRIRFRGWDQLEQPKIPGRIEEVRAEPMAPEVVAASFGQQGDGNPRSIRTNDGILAPCHIDTGQQLLLDIDTLDNRLHDPVDVCQACKPGVEACSRDQASYIGRVLRVGLESNRLFQTFTSDFRRQIEKQHWKAGVGAVQRNLGTHGAGAENRDGFDSHADVPALRARVGGFAATPPMNKSVTTSASATSE